LGEEITNTGEKSDRGWEKKGKKGGRENTGVATCRSTIGRKLVGKKAKNSAGTPGGEGSINERWGTSLQDH